MKRIIGLPQQREIARAVLGAIVSLASVSAYADCFPGGTVASSTSSNISWITGNCTVNPGITVSGYVQRTALVSSSSVGTLINSGTLSGYDYGLFNNGTIASIQNNSGGKIIGSTSYAAGLSNNGNIGTLSNNGTISSGSTGILNSGNIGTLSNGGTISGAGGLGYNSFIGINNLGNGTITELTNLAGSTITGASQAIYNAGTIDTLNNSGLITSAGTISNNHGIDNSGTIAALNNLGGGTISGNLAISNSGTIQSLVNGGAISGDSVGVQNNGTIVALNNNSGGTISGVTTAVINNSGASIGTLTNAGLIAGNIVNLSSNVLNIGGGSGNNVGTLTGASGGLGSADMGSITSTGANLNFSGGNLLLNDNITATGHTVNNSGAVLLVNNHVAITGDYHQGAAAALQIGVGSGAQSGGLLADAGYGRLIVSGNAVVDAGSSVALKALSYNFAVGQRFVVIQAGSATYNASTLTYSADGFTGAIEGTVSTEGGYASLVLNLSAGSTPGGGSGGGGGRSSYANNGNAASALNGLFNYNGTNAQLLNVFNPALALNDTDSANRAGAQLNPTAVQQAAIKGVDAANNAVFNVTSNHLDGLRLAQGSASGVATGERSLAPALWGQFFGGGATQDQRDGLSGYHANYRGMVMGGDLQATESWRAGGLLSYAKTNVGNDDNNTGSSASVNSYGLTAYAGYDGKPWYVNVMAGVARQKYSTVRAIGYTGFSGTAYGDFNGLQSSASVQAGYPLALANDMTVTPMAGLTYSKLRQNGYTESGGSGAALVVDAATTTSLKSDIGAKLDRKFQTSYGEMTPSVQLRWRHELQNSRLNTGASFAADSSGATSFTTVGATPIKNTGVMVLGLTLARSKDMSVTANYTLEAGQGYTSQTGDIRVRWQY